MLFHRRGFCSSFRLFVTLVKRLVQNVKYPGVSGGYTLKFSGYIGEAEFFGSKF